MTMTKTKTYKKTNTKTVDTHTDKYKVLPRPNVYYIYQKQGVQGFKILYWLSSCDDKDKNVYALLGVNIFQNLEGGTGNQKKMSLNQCFISHL